MKYAADFRYIAREALRGKWLVAVLTAFAASLIGAQIASGGSRGGSNNDENNRINLNEYFSPEVLNFFRIALTALLIYAVISIIITLIIGGAGKLGYARFNLNLVDGKKARVEDLFSQFHRLGDGFGMVFLMGLYEFLWSLLFVIPGIIKSFSYAMTPYILSEHPEYNPNYAITLSREMMNGNKFRLFCLNLSFIGWSLLAALPGIIAVTAVLVGNFFFLPLILVTIVGDLFVGAYMEAANAAFYREVSGTIPQAEMIYVENE
ncbi:MAG: DUF975 family protein [Oscillospiraceae bacterium]|nr:DUF975 family protein [Oscillospiraceae bacterium]